MQLYSFVFTGNDPRKGWRIPLNEIKYNEQRNEKTCYGYCDQYQPHAARRIYDQENGMLLDRYPSQEKRRFSRVAASFSGLRTTGCTLPSTKNTTATTSTTTAAGVAQVESRAKLA